MPAHLIIHDGASPYWWNSPDIWVVPGNDPNGPPGSPIAGQPAYMWARVSNSGSSPANGTRVDFYWANPSAQMVVGVATPIGSAFADLAPGTTQDVLCLVPWVPVVVNGGHECVLAVAHGPGDTAPIPDPLPNGYAFDPPAHDQIAQLNLSVLSTAMLRAPLQFVVQALPREAKRARLSVDVGGQLDERVLANRGLRGLKPAQGHAVQVSLERAFRCYEHPDPHPCQSLEVDVPRGGAVVVYVQIHAQHLRPGEYQLVHVLEHSEQGLAGGVSYAIVHHATQAEEQAS